MLIFDQIYIQKKVKFNGTNTDINTQINRINAMGTEPLGGNKASLKTDYLRQTPSHRKSENA